MTTHRDSRGRIIAPGDVRIPPTAPPEPAGAARYVRQSTLDALAAPPRPQTPLSRSRVGRAARLVRNGVLGVAATLGVIHTLASAAPKEIAKPVSAAEFDSACASYGPAISAQLQIEDAGSLHYYQVTCENHGYPLPMQVAR